MTSVPSPTFGIAGFEAPAETDILAGVTEDINAAFGGNLNPSAASPQGQIATSVAAAIGDRNDLFLLFTNLIDPAFSYGRMQDAIARLYFLTRIPATATVVSVTCIGKVGVSIPTGALVQDDAGYIYASLENATIPNSGYVTVQFACQTLGPIACAAGAISTIYQAIPGWDSVTNSSAGTIGRDAETSHEFEARRTAAVAKNSSGSVSAAVGALLDLDGVTDAYGYSNDTASTVTHRGVSIGAHSMYISVNGGTDANVAQTIWEKKTPGCVYTGDVSVTVKDTSDVYSEPYPEYTVLFNRPDDLGIAVIVTLVSSTSIPSDVDTQVQDAIVEAAAGNDGGDRLRIGTDIVASRYYSPVADLGTWAKIRSIKIGSANSPSASGTGFIEDDTMTISSVTSGAFAADQYVSSIGGGVVAGTTIVAQLSGTTGGAGTYQVSSSQTTPIGTLYGVSATLDAVTVNADQIPSIDASMVTVEIS